MPPQIPIHLNFDSMVEQIGRLVGAPIGQGAGAAGAGLGGRAASMVGRGLAGPEGKRMETVGRGLGQIAKQLPGAGVFGDMAGAMKKGGVMGAGMAGVAGIMGFVKQILQSSKVFQGIAGSFFKIFGAMADVFLIPFLPIAMKGMNQLMKYLPMMSKKGQEMANRLEEFFKAVQGNKLGAFFKQFVMVPIFEALNKLVSKGTEGVIAAKDYTYNIKSGEIESELEEGVAESGMVRTGQAVANSDLVQRDVENIKALKTLEGWFGRGGLLAVPDMFRGRGAYEEQQALEKRLGPKWRELQHLEGKQLGGLVSGIHQGGAGGGGSRSSGLNTELGNPLRNIRGKSMDVISGVGEDVLQLQKDTDTYVNTSARDFRTISTGFIGGVRQTLLTAGSNISAMQNEVNKQVVEVNDGINEINKQVAQVNNAAEQTIMVIGSQFADELEALEEQANDTRNKILDKAINFGDMSKGWYGDTDNEGLSAAELEKIAAKLEAQLVKQKDFEKEQERLRLERERKLLEQQKLERERLERERILAEKEAAAALQKAKDEEEARKAEEYRINTLKADPMFKSFEAMQRKLDSLRSRLASQEASSAGIRANMAHVKSAEVMDAWVGPLGDSRSAVGLQKRRRQQYWTGVVMPAQDAWQQHTETMSQTRQDIQNVENWIARKHIPDIYYNYQGRVFENQGNIASHQRSNLNYDAGGIVAGDIGEPQLIWAQGGEQISPIGMPKNNGGGNTSNRVLNISIETKSSVKEILIDLANLKTLDNASLFNSVW